MNIEEENKTEEFYLNSNIEGEYCTRNNTVKLNYLDLRKLMHSYAESEVKKLALTNVSQRSELLLFRKWQEQNWNHVYLYEDKFMIDTYLSEK